jgi:hypothetical protein
MVDMADLAINGVVYLGAAKAKIKSARSTGDEAVRYFSNALPRGGV